MTIDWTILTDIVTVETLATFAAGGLVTDVCKRFVATSPSKSLLDACRKDLENFAWRINQLTPGQRSEIAVLSRQSHGKCKSIDQIEQDYLKLLDNNDEMWTRHAESSIVQRRYWASQLMVDITNLKQKIKVLQDDILNTTTSRNEEARRLQDRLGRVQSKQVEHQPPPPTSVPGRQRVEPRVEHDAQPGSSTTMPGEYLLHGIYPPTAPLAAHITARPPSIDIV